MEAGADVRNSCLPFPSPFPNSSLLDCIEMPLVSPLITEASADVKQPPPLLPHPHTIPSSFVLITAAGSTSVAFPQICFVCVSSLFSSPLKISLSVSRLLMLAVLCSVDHVW